MCVQRLDLTGRVCSSPAGLAAAVHFSLLLSCSVWAEFSRPQAGRTVSVQICGFCIKSHVGLILGWLMRMLFSPQYVATLPTWRPCCWPASQLLPYCVPLDLSGWVPLALALLTAAVEDSHGPCPLHVHIQFYVSGMVVVFVMGQVGHWVSFTALLWIAGQLS